MYFSKMLSQSNVTNTALIVFKHMGTTPYTQARFLSETQKSLQLHTKICKSGIGKEKGGTQHSISPYKYSTEHIKCLTCTVSFLSHKWKQTQEKL